MSIQEAFVFIYYNAVYGGAQTFILRKAHWLINNDYRVIIVTIDGPMVDEYKRVGAEVIVVNKVCNDIGILNAFEFQNLLEILINRLSRYKVKVVEGVDPISGLTASWIAQMLNAKLVVGILHPTIYTREWSQYLKKWDKINSLYAINRACYESYTKNHGIIWENENIIPVPIEIETNVNNQNRFDNITILTIARHEFDKIYISGLIKSFDLIKEKYINAKLIIIGDGSYRKKFENIASNNLYSSDITFTGRLPPNELKPYYEKCSIFVGMGTTALHAAMYKKPALIAYWGNSNDEGPGYLCDLPDDSFGEYIENWKLEKYHIQILRVLDDPRLYDDIAQRCYDRVLNRYEINCVMHRWIELINNSNKENETTIGNIDIDYNIQTEVKSCLKRFLKIHRTRGLRL